MNWNGPSDWTYKFYTEDGFFELDYSDYLGDFKNTHIESELMRKVKDMTRANLYLGRTILSYDRQWLAAHESEQMMFNVLRDAQEDNPLQFYCPNGMEMVRMLNDTESDIKGLIAANRIGKSTCAWIDTLLDIVPCDPSWNIFTEHGVNFRPFAPPKGGFVTAVASYEKVNLESTLWPQVIKVWTPKKFIEEYVIDGKGRKTINFRGSPRIKTDYVDIWLMHYSMSQTPFESQAVDRFMWDEQGEEAKFDGADERLRTRNGRHVFSLTPHKVVGRPDTGAGTWIHDMDLGATTKGHQVSFFHAPLLDNVPDWIYPEKQKIMAYEKWVIEPERLGNHKMMKEGESRLFGVWHESGGLVYDEWSRDVHLIDPFEIPNNWTRYRSIDWGRVNPTVCLWSAVSPEGDLYIYDGMYKTNSVVSDSCKCIIEKSGNKVVPEAGGFDPQTGQVYQRFRESFVGNKFFATILDGRSHRVKTPDTGLTIGMMFANNGVQCIPASTADTYLTIPIVKEWLTPDWEKINPFTGELGCSRVFVFRTMSKFIYNIEHYKNKEVTRTARDGQTSLAERPVAKDDHDMDAFRYLIMAQPRFAGEFSRFDEDEDVEPVVKRRTDSYTGY